MITKTLYVMAVFVNAITCQRLLPSCNCPRRYAEVFDRLPSPQIPPTSTSDNDILCKNLATAIQNVVFDRFSMSCLRQPVFGPMAGPLINDIKNSICQCPLCSAVNVTPNGYTKSYVTPNAVSNIIKNTIPNTVSNTYARGPNVSFNKKYTDLLAVLGGFGCDCGCRGPVVG